MHPVVVDRRWPWGVAGAALLLTVLAVPPAVTTARAQGLDEVYVVNALVGVVVPPAGALVLSRSRHRVGGVLLATAGLALSFCLGAWGRTGSSAWQDWSLWLADLAWIPFLGVLTLLPLWFPTGRLPSRGWWPLPWAVTGLLVATLLVHALAPRLTDGRPTPLAVSLPDGTEGLPRALVVAVVLSSLACAASALHRYVRAGEADRRRLRSFVVAVGVTVAVLFLPGLPVVVSDVACGLAVGLVAFTAAAAVLDHGTLGVGVWVDRSLATALAGAALLAIYVAAVALTAALAPAAVAFLAAAAVAVAVAPVHAAARRAVDRALHGRRSDPLGALEAVGGRTVSPTGRVDLDAVAHEVLACLRVPCVEVTTPGGTGRAGRPAGEDVEVWPLLAHGVGLGAVAVWLRPGEAALHPDDRRLLAALVRTVATSLRVASLAADLADSRARIVTAREEERRRLHHDLHDGLGPTLSHAVLAVDGVAAGLPEHDAGAVHDDLAALKLALRRAVDDLRGTVQGLRPAALDDLGLLGLLRRQAELLGAGGLRVETETADLPALPAAVEVAALRIASEALTNVARHARATRCVVTLTVVGTELVVAVDDDGVGTRGPAGIGIESLRTRAEELGGSVEIAARETGGTGRDGTRVRARLPIPEVGEHG